MTISAQLVAIDTKLVFFIGLIIVASGVISPPAALALGLCFGFLFVHPLRAESGQLAKTLLKMSVVALGFGMNVSEVLKVGRSGFIYTAISIFASLGFGLLLGRSLKVQRTASLLITVGTAICGGSAIAAVAPVVAAGEEEISVAMGTVFILNSVALFAFPLIGSALHFTQDQFGLWAALAIHDTSSVVGATAKFGNQAVIVGTTVKLARALWIIPVSLGVAAWYQASARRYGTAGVRSRIKLPWFILFFCLATVLRTYVSEFKPLFDVLVRLGRTGLAATLFLIGTGLSYRMLHQVGYRPFLQGLLLWVAIASLSALSIYYSIVSL